MYAKSVNSLTLVTSLTIIVLVLFVKSLTIIVPLIFHKSMPEQMLMGKPDYDLVEGVIFLPELII